MMNRISIFIASLLIAVLAMAENRQQGYVKTRGRMSSTGSVIPGKRLSGATVVIQGGSSVQSDGGGDFILRLPATKFFLKDVKKAGYLVADQDILSKQYAYSANPLVLVLDEPEAQQDDRLASERKLRRNLQRQLQQREDELEALKEENRITQEQYREALQNLYADQESNEKFIAEMAERYSRIDFDQLDEFQTQMAAFIQNGELSRADSLLRTKGNMDDREAEIQRLRKANEAERAELAHRQDDLSKSEKTEAVLLADFGADCYNHFELCKLKFDNDSAAYWLERRAKADTTNIDWQLDAGDFIAMYLADYAASLNYLNNTLASAIRRLGDNHPDLASIYIRIGLALKKRGDYESALEYCNKALEIQLESIGEKHPDVALNYNYIGTLHSKLGNYNMALDYLNKALSLIKETCGEEDLNISLIHNNLGTVHEHLGDHSGALDNFTKSLELELKVLGEESTNTAISYNNVGCIYEDLGEYPTALKYYNNAMKIQLAIYGEKHPQVATIHNNIGSLYFNMNDNSKSIENFNKALKIRLDIFGENNPDVAACYNNLGIIYNRQGDHQSALEYYNKALTIWLETLDEDHPLIATCYNNIGRVYCDLKNYTSSIEYLKNALLKRLSRLGENHIDVAMSYSNLGHTYYNCGNYAEALECHNNALKIKLDMLGEDHKDVARSYYDIGEIYYMQKDYSSAIEVCNKALKIHLKALDKQDPFITKFHVILYSYYQKGAQGNDSLKEDFRLFMKDKVWVGTVTGKDSQAARLGLNGEFVFFKLGDWEYGCNIEFLENNQKLTGKPKDVVLFKDGEIYEHHFENRMGIEYGLRSLTPSDKNSVEEKFKQWKNNQRQAMESMEI